MKRAALLILLALCVSGFSGNKIERGARALHQSLWLPLTTTPTPGAADGSSAWSFTRNSVATYLAASGFLAIAPANEAVFEWDATGKALGFRSEGSRANLVYPSGAPTQGFSGSRWTLSGLTLQPATAIGPFGETSTMYCHMENSDTAQPHKNTSASFAITASKFVASTVWARPAGRTLLVVRLLGNNSGNSQVTFNLSTQTVGTISLAAGFKSSSALCDSQAGWVRCRVTTWNDADTTAQIILYMAASDGVLTYNGDGTSSLFIASIQVEDNAAFPSSYIPTTTAAVTRAADVLTYAAGANVPVSEGTIMATAEFYNLPSIGYNRILDTLPSSNFNGVAMYLNLGSTNLTGLVYSGNVIQAAFNGSSGATVGACRRYTLRWAENAFFTYANGVQIGSDSTGSAPLSHQRIAIGCDYTSLSPTWGHVKDVRIWDVALTAREIATINAALGAP